MGAAEFFIHHKVGRFTLPVVVHCRLGGVAVVEEVLLDTGAQWSVLGGTLLQTLAGDLEDLGETVDIGTRFGRFSGTLCRLDVTFVADPGLGRNLRIDATVLAVPDWPGPVVLGYLGLLERARLALDPSVDGRSILFFGRSE
jgi:hypothetical protein